MLATADVMLVGLGGYPWRRRLRAALAKGCEQLTPKVLFSLRNEGEGRSWKELVAYLESRGCGKQQLPLPDTQHPSHLSQTHLQVQYQRKCQTMVFSHSVADL